MKSNYNKFPTTKIKGHEQAAVVGYSNILDTLKKEIPSGKYIVTCDVYPGVRDEEILPELEKLQPSLLINMLDVFKEEKTITEQLKYFLPMTVYLVRCIMVRFPTLSIWKSWRLRRSR